MLTVQTALHSMGIKTMLSSRLLPRKQGYKIKGTNITIRKRPDVQNWEVSIYFPDEQKSVVNSTHTQDLDEAIMFGLNRKSQLNFMRQNGIDIFTITFERVANEWLAYLREREKSGSQSPHTLVILEGIAKNHLIPHFGKMGINSIKSETIQPYIQKLIEGGIKSRVSFSHHNMALGKMLKYAQGRGLYKHNSIPALEIPTYKLKDAEPRTLFTDDEIEIIKANLDRYIEEATTKAGRYNRCGVPRGRGIPVGGGPTWILVG